MLAAVNTVVMRAPRISPRRVSSLGFMGSNLTLDARAPHPQRLVEIALSDVRDPSAPFFATITTESPTASDLEPCFSWVTGVFGGTVPFCEPPAYCTTIVEPLVLATLPLDIRDCDTAPLVMRDAETLPFVILLALPLVMRLALVPALGAIIRLPSPRPLSSSGNMWISVARSDPSLCFTVVTPMKVLSLTSDMLPGALA